MGKLKYVRKICYSCQGKDECITDTEENWKDCRGKSYLKNDIYNPKLIKKLSKNSVEV